MPEMISTDLKLVPLREQYGLVVVGGVNKREYKITSEELDKVKKSAKGFPPGVTQKEWESGRVVLHGKVLNVGEACENEDGSLLVKFGETKVKGQFVEKIAMLTADEWSRNGGTVAVSLLANELLFGKAS